MFQADEQHKGKCSKTQRYETCNSQIKKKLFSFRTQLSYKFFLTNYQYQK